MARLFTKENMARLTEFEQGEFMRLQMSSPYGGRSAYLPDDCGGGGACGDTMLGSGWCQRCYARYAELECKAIGEAS